MVGDNEKRTTHSLFFDHWDIGESNGVSSSDEGSLMILGAKDNNDSFLIRLISSKGCIRSVGYRHDKLLGKPSEENDTIFFSMGGKGRGEGGRRSLGCSWSVCSSVTDPA